MIYESNPPTATTTIDDKNEYFWIKMTMRNAAMMAVMIPMFPKSKSITNAPIMIAIKIDLMSPPSSLLPEKYKTIKKPKKVAITLCNVVASTNTL